MKSARFFLVVILLLGICPSWVCASAIPIDPTLIINKGTGYPACLDSPTSDSTPTCLHGNTITESFNNGSFSFDFAYVNQSVDLTTLFITITGVPVGTPYFCQSDIWSACNFGGDGGVFNFALSGGDKTHPGFIPKFIPGTAPATFGVDEVPSAPTPEPGMWLLFAAMLAFLLTKLGRKRWGTPLLT